CKRFNLDASKALNGMREYIDEESRKIPADLHELHSTISTLPTSTAECERTFSTINIIVTDQRSSLTVENTRNLLVLNINGPPIQEFCPTSYVKKWLKSQRSASDAKSRVCKDKSSDIEKL